MDVENRNSEHAQNLRRRAEEIDRQRGPHGTGHGDDLSPEQARKALHELRVHQIELEMQNEELRRTQAELEASRARYFDLYDLAPMGYLTLSETGMIMEANLLAATLLGVDRRTMTRHPLSHFLLPEDQDIYYQHHRQVVQSGARHDCELRMLRAGAAPFWARLEESAIQGDSSLPAFLVAVSDISTSKRTEAERQIIEEHLLQSQMLESVGRLAGGVAHEFNNMLLLVNAHADLALAFLSPSDPLTPHMEAIAKAGARSADIVRQLLGFARKQIISPQILDLNAMVANTLEILRGLIGSSIEILWKPGSHPCLVMMDPGQIDQILVNLVLNARDSILGAGRIAIGTDTMDLGVADVGAHPGIPPGPYALLAVSDTGRGIDKETQAKLFEPFSTLKPSGTSLCLPTVYGIVKQNNGHIEVESEPGQGATFRILIPRTQASAHPSDAVNGTQKPPSGTETVLLVDDEELLLGLGKLQLEDLGYTVLATSNPAQAIRMAADYPGEIHLLVSDVMMPGMSGRELRDKLHAARPGMKCLFMSGYSSDVIAHRGVLDSGVHFLEKPFTREKLARMLREALDNP